MAALWTIGAPAQAQIRPDSLKIPKNLYLKIEHYLSVWDSVSRVPEAVLPKSEFVTVSRRHLDAIYPDVMTNLLRFQTYRMKEVEDLAETIEALFKIRYPDSTASPCRFLHFSTDSCLTVPRAVWKNNLRNLTLLHRILTASTRDSTLVWKETTEKPTISTNFWGRHFITLSGRIDFLSPERDTVYTLTIHRLKVAAKFKRNFWQKFLTANWQFRWSFEKRRLAQNWAIGISSANCRRFFGEIFLGTGGVGFGGGWRLFENAGPMCGGGPSVLRGDGFLWPESPFC